LKIPIKWRKLESAELRELKARGYVFEGMAFLAMYSGLNISAVYSILRGVAVIEALLAVLCAPIPWFISTLLYIAGYVSSRGLRSKILAELFIASGATSLAVGCALLVAFSLALARLPDMLIHQLETGALGFWGFLLEIVGFLLLAVLERTGLMYLLVAAPISMGGVLVLMGVKRRPVLEVY